MLIVLMLATPLTSLQLGLVLLKMQMFWPLVQALRIPLLLGKGFKSESQRKETCIVPILPLAYMS
jgi:hypothetical protein